MSGSSLMYWNEKLGKTQPRVVKFVYKINGAGDIALITPGGPALSSFAALSQATIDAFLGNSLEFTAAQFDATAMGVDSLAIIVNMAGQADKFTQAKVRMYGADGALDIEEQMQVLGLTDSTLATEAELGANGNMALRAIVTGIDALAAGTIEVELEYISK